MSTEYVHVHKMSRFCPELEHRTKKDSLFFFGDNDPLLQSTAKINDIDLTDIVLSQYVHGIAGFDDLHHDANFQYFDSNLHRQRIQSNCRRRILRNSFSEAAARALNYQKIAAPRPKKVLAPQ